MSLNGKREFKKTGLVEKIFALDKQRCCEIRQCIRVLSDLKGEA